MDGAVFQKNLKFIQYKCSHYVIILNKGVVSDVFKNSTFEKQYDIFDFNTHIYLCVASKFEN